MTHTPNKFGKGGFDNADSSFQGLGNLQYTYPWGPGIPGCTDPTAVNYNPNATIDDGSCITAVYGCMDVTAENYDCECSATAPFPAGGCGDGVNVNGNCCIIIGCTDPAYAEYNPLANQPDPTMCITLISYGCTDTSTMNISDGQSLPYNTHTNASTSFTAPCDGTFVPCVMDAYSQMQTGPNCCCIDTIVGCTDPSASNYNSSANTSPNPGSNLECQYYNFGCTDPSAFNYDPASTQDNGSCLYYGCTNPAASNYGWGTNNSNTWSVTNTGDIYVNPTAPITLGYTSGSAFDDGSCIIVAVVAGCMDPTAANYNPSVTVDNGSCLYVGCSYLQTSWNLQATATFGYTLTANTYTSSSLVLETFVQTPGVHPDWMGTQIIQGVNFTDDGSCEFTGCADDGNCTVATCGYNSPYPGIPASNYNPPINNDAWPGVGIVDNGSCQYTNFGCMDTTVGDNPDINGDCTNGTNVGYPNLGGCGTGNGYLAENYDPAALTNFGCIYSSSLVYGCTDPLATNYDPLANVNNGTCCYGNPTGCMDPNANNFDPCATTPCSGCCTYDGCPASVVNALNAGCSSFYEAGSTTPCNTYNITVNDGSCIIPFNGCYVPDDNLKRALWDNFNNQQYGGAVASTIDWSDFKDVNGTNSATSYTDVVNYDYIDVTKLDTGAVVSHFDFSEFGINDPTGIECLGGNIESFSFNKTESNFLNRAYPGQPPYGQNGDWSSWKFMWDLPNDNTFMSNTQPGLTFTPSYGTKTLNLNGTNVGHEAAFSMYEYNSNYGVPSQIGVETLKARLPIGDAFPLLEYFLCNECHLGGALDPTSGQVLNIQDPFNHNDVVRFFHIDTDMTYPNVNIYTHRNPYLEAIRPTTGVDACPIVSITAKLNPAWHIAVFSAPGNSSNQQQGGTARGNFPNLRVLRVSGIGGVIGWFDTLQTTAGNSLTTLDLNGTATGNQQNSAPNGGFSWTANPNLTYLGIANTNILGGTYAQQLSFTGMPNLWHLHAWNMPTGATFPDNGKAYFYGSYGQYIHTAGAGFYPYSKINLSPISSNFLNNPIGLAAPVIIDGPGMSLTYDSAQYPQWPYPNQNQASLDEIQVASGDEVAFHTAYGGDGTYPFVGVDNGPLIATFDEGIEITS